jgi:3-dehydroquinate synthase
VPTVPVVLPHTRYDVVIEPGALTRLGEVVRALAPAARAALFVDPAVRATHAPLARASLERAGYAVVEHALPGGEARKDLDAVRALYDVLLEHRLERRSPVIARGGGVTGDTVGFAAATYLRGVPFVQCPTTLLAMVDSSVGGKVGVNVPQGKNLIGAFHQPVAVIADTLALRTLPARELRCGLAECIKHAVIRDASLFAWTRANMSALLALDADALTELVARNVAIKAAVVTEDEKETGVRAHLNFGHTFGHAIEASVGYGAILHGEAVGLGMLAATTLAASAGLCDPGSGRARVTRRRGRAARARAPARRRTPARRDGARQEGRARAHPLRPAHAPGRGRAPRRSRARPHPRRLGIDPNVETTREDSR